MSATATNVIATEAELRANKFVAGATQANKALDGLIRGNLNAGSAVDGLRGKLLGMGAPAAAAGAAVIGVGLAIGGLVSKAIQLGDELQNLSNRTGETVENLSLLKFAADQEDVSMGQVASGLRIASQRAVEASRGNKEAAASFKRLGIDIRDANGNLKSGTELLRDIGEGLKSIPPGTERTAAAVEILGRSGTQLIPLLTNLGALTTEAEELGLTVSSRFARDADEFGDNMAKLKSLSVGFGLAIAETVLPALNDFLKALVDLGKDVLPVFRDLVDDSAFALVKLGTAADLAVIGPKLLGQALSRNSQTAEEAKAKLQELFDELIRSKEAWLAQRDAAKAAGDETAEAGAKAVTAADHLAALNEQMKAFAEGPAQIKGLVDFFGDFSDALGAGNVQLKDLLANLERVAQVSPEAAAALSQIREAQAGALDAGIIENIPRRALPGEERREEIEQQKASAERFDPTQFALPGGGQPIEQPNILVDQATAADDLAAALLEADINADRLNTSLDRGRSTLEAFGGFADGLTTALIETADGAAKAFADFFKGLLKGLAAAIVRALILRALLSVFGGVPGIGKLLGAAQGQVGALGFQDQESSMLGRAAQARSFGAGLGGVQLAGAGGLPTPSVTVRPQVTVNNATRATWVDITDNEILPRLRTRQRRLNDDLK